MDKARSPKVQNGLSQLCLLNEHEICLLSNWNRDQRLWSSWNSYQLLLFGLNSETEMHALSKNLLKTTLLGLFVNQNYVKQNAAANLLMSSRYDIHHISMLSFDLLCKSSKQQTHLRRNLCQPVNMGFFMGLWQTGEDSAFLLDYRLKCTITSCSMPVS